MTTGAVAATIPVQPLFAEGRILAGFLDEQSASRYSEFLRSPVADQDKVREKFSSVSVTDRSLRTPKFRQVQEQDAIGLLGQVSGQCGGPLILNNLVGFEWVEIASIVAGRFVASPMPLAGKYPTTASSLLEVAQYCILGSVTTSEDLNLVPQPNQLLVVCPEKLRLHPVLHPNPGPQGGFVVEYRMQREPSPISLLYVDDRLIALNHQERLVSLMKAGVKEALCLVHYGYGTEMLGLLPNIEPTVLASDAVPFIDDFLNQDIAISIPVAKARSLITLTHHTTDLTIID